MLRVRVEKLKVHPLAELLIPPLSDEEYASLLYSVSRHGILKALDVVEKEGEYLVIDGCHRLKAARELKLKRVPVNVMVFGSDDEIAEYILTLQTARRNLTPHQKGAVACEWMEKTGMDEKEAAKRFGVSRRIILDVLEVKRKDPELYRLLREGHISGRALTGVLLRERESVEVDYDLNERIDRLERERDLLREELRKKEEIAEKLDQIKRRIRTLEAERDELRRLVKELYAVSRERPQKERASKREEIMGSLFHVPFSSSVPSGDEIPLTDDHRRIEEISERISEALSPASVDELFELLSAQSALPERTARLLGRLFEDASSFLKRLSAELSRIALSSGPDLKERERFLIITHGATENSET